MKTLRNAIIFGLLSCSVMTTASAQESYRDKYFAVTGYFYDPDDERGTDREGTGLDIAFGLQLIGPLYAEARAFGAVYETGVGGGSDAYNGGVGLDLSLLLGQRGNFAAFGIGGVAFAYNDSKYPYPDEGVFQGNLGVGLLSRALTPADIRIRIEARAFYEDYIGGVNDFRIGAGLEIPVDAAEIVVREVPVATEPAAPPTNLAYPPRPKDSDNDNVLDNFDACPGTLPKTRVDRAGCAIPQHVVLRGVHFEFNSDRLTSGSLSILDQAAAAMKGQPQMRVRVAGHTDSIGSASYNEELSMRRARTVKLYLVAQGIAPARLSLVGHGEAQPLTSNETEEGRALNRRVVFEIQEQGDNPR